MEHLLMKVKIMKLYLLMNLLMLLKQIKWKHLEINIEILMFY